VVVIKPAHITDRGNPKKMKQQCNWLSVRKIGKSEKDDRGQ
jgi:hypothetical protein